MKSLTIAGNKRAVRPLTKKEQGGLWLEVLANFDIGKFDFNGSAMLLLAYKTEANYTPMQLRKISERIETAKGLPVVFYFERLLTFERDRLVEQGIYFVASDKYAFVPTLIVNRKGSNRVKEDRFYPSTQYILFHHLQIASINGMKIKELEDVMPYKYKTIARSISQLQQLGLVELSGSREYSIAIKIDRETLWAKSLRHLVNPCKDIYFSPTSLSAGWIGGISALSHYTMLAPENVPTKVVTADQFREIKQTGRALMPVEDVQRIEVWKYPPLSHDGYVDKLSLYLTLKDDKDPRVEKELETMIKNIL